MKSASLAEIRRELKTLTPAQLQGIAELLAKYSADNKAYLSYLLYEAHNRADYLQAVKLELEEGFAAIGAESNLYYSKKTLRKLLRQLNKYAKYMGDSAAQIELLLYYCNLLQQSGLPFQKSALITNLYAQVLKKAGKLIASVHEDLQGDFMPEWIRLGGTV